MKSSLGEPLVKISDFFHLFFFTLPFTYLKGLKLALTEHLSSTSFFMKTTISIKPN